MALAVGFFIICAGLAVARGSLELTVPICVALRAFVLAASPVVSPRAETIDGKPRFFNERLPSGDAKPGSN